MSEKLLEADFLTVDLKSTFSRQVSDESSIMDELTATQVDVESSENNSSQRQTNFDWGKELKNRLESNRKMSSEARQSEYAIETQFFKEFFTSNWDAECAKQLMLIGEPLRRALRVLGFNKRVNPILGFISLKYVQEKLIKTKLLNVNTFKVIYNAVAKKLVADSEFFRASDYNIIYCQDLYKKPLTDIEKYLKAQSGILKTSLDTYTVDIQLLNKKVFIYIPKIKELDPIKRAREIKKATNIKLPSVKNSSTILNELEVVKAFGGTGSSASSDTRIPLNAEEQASLVGKLDTSAKMFAALQYLSITTSNANAKKALSNDEFQRISANDIATATAQIAGIMPKGQLSKKAAEALVNMIVSKM